MADSSSSSSSTNSSTSTVSDPNEFTLISSDKRSFFIPSTASDLSRVINHRLENKAWPENFIVLEMYDGNALEPVVEYLRGNGQASHDEETKMRFETEFLSDSQSANAVLSAALDLEIPGLADLASEKLRHVTTDIDRMDSGLRSSEEQLLIPREHPDAQHLGRILLLIGVGISLGLLLLLALNIFQFD